VCHIIDMPALVTSIACSQRTVFVIWFSIVFHTNNWFCTLTNAAYSIGVSVLAKCTELRGIIC